MKRFFISMLLCVFTFCGFLGAKTTVHAQSSDYSDKQEKVKLDVSHETVLIHLIDLSLNELNDLSLNELNDLSIDMQVIDESFCAFDLILNKYFIDNKRNRYRFDQSKGYDIHQYLSKSKFYFFYYNRLLNGKNLKA